MCVSVCIYTVSYITKNTLLSKQNIKGKSQFLYCVCVSVFVFFMSWFPYSFKYINYPTNWKPHRLLMGVRIFWHYVIFLFPISLFLSQIVTPHLPPSHPTPPHPLPLHAVLVSLSFRIHTIWMKRKVWVWKSLFLSLGYVTTFFIGYTHTQDMAMG